MRLLTPGLPQHVPGARLVPAPSQPWSFNHRGKTFVFDSNSMTLAEQEPDDTDKDFENLCQGVKAVFPLEIPRWPGAILFSVTHRCTLSCEYCFCSADSLRSRTRTDMPFAFVEQFVSQLLAGKPRQSRSPISCSFFGGEPLLRWKFIRQVTGFLQRWVGNLNFHVTTNGTMLTKKICSFLRRLRFGAIVSLDGPAAAHDELRRTRKGKGSFRLVMRGLKTLCREAPEVSRRTTLRATFTLDSLRSCSLAKRLDYLNNLCDEGLGGHVSVEPAFLGELMCMDRSLLEKTAPDFADEDAMAMWSQQYSDAADWWLERLRSDQVPRFHHFSYLLRRLLFAQPAVSECGAGKGYASLAPDGTIYACHREAGTKIGHASYGVDHELAAPWQDNRYYARLRCSTCPIRNVCGGGCREISHSQGLGLAMPLKAECEFRKLQFLNCCWILSELTEDERVRVKEIVGGQQRCKHK